MERDEWPPDTGEARERLRTVILELDDASEDDGLVLLSKLLCAAWGSVTAQNQ
jgi:hypothetical protein